MTKMKKKPYEAPELTAVSFKAECGYAASVVNFDALMLLELDSGGNSTGNQVEVYEVKQMLASTRMKGLEDQQLFWKMRDHTLLCFRICERPTQLLEKINHLTPLIAFAV